MKFAQARPGRDFILRLEDGEIIHDVIERFAEDQKIKAASVILLGGADEGSRLVVGPKQGRASPIVPMEHVLDGVHEIAGVGTLFPDEEGAPSLHLHIAGGRQNKAVAGCIRQGVKTWIVAEAVIQELLDCPSTRRLDPKTGFTLLEP
jgi:predicted DNA-binding protein with PD1-like motif